MEKINNEPTIQTLMDPPAAEVAIIIGTPKPNKISKNFPSRKKKKKKRVKLGARLTTKGQFTK